jgi:hypothetical protein
MHIRYTDFVNNFDEVLRRLGLFIGFDLQTTQREFWKFPHHYVKGNPGTVTHRRFAGSQSQTVRAKPSQDFSG